MQRFRASYHYNRMENRIAAIAFVVRKSILPEMQLHYVRVN
jgi:hypothetical protein